VSGPAIIRHLIAHDAAMLTLLSQMESSAANVIVGKKKAGAALPVIAIRLVSGTELNTLAMNEGKRLRTQRVQVMVHGKTARQVLQLLEAVLVACPNTRGTLNGIKVDSILPDGEGPDFSDPDAEVFEQSRDFIVRWNATA